MKWLWSGGGENSLRFRGVLTCPAHKGTPAGIVAGRPWAADNEKYTRGKFDPARFFCWLDTMRPYRDQCLFVAVPDEVGNAPQTIALWRYWVQDERLRDWPLAFVAQDGMENYPLPPADTYAALFVGGSTEWKEGAAAISVIKRAQTAGRHIHIGRVNWGRRYRLFRQINGSEEFTCDGTRQRFEGVERTSAAWKEIQQSLVLPLW